MLQRVISISALSGLLCFLALGAFAQNQKISELDALTGANTATADELAIVDTTATQTKRITRDELAIGLGGPMGIVTESTPGTAPTATGTDALGMGDGAVAGNAAGDNGVLAIGARSTATGADSICIGENCDATGANSIAIGGSTTDASSADATADAAIAMGQLTKASATAGMAFGNSAQATAVRATAIGQNTDASGANCTAIGGNATDTDSADCSAADSVAIGQHILADDIGEFAFASGEFSTQSDAHTSIYVLRRNTTDDTQGEMFTNGVASEGGTISVDSDCAVSFRINIVARATASADFGAGYLITGVADNNAGTTALIGSVTVVTIAEDVANWDVTVTADDGNDELNVLVTGVTTNDINWVARAEVAAVCG